MKKILLSIVGLIFSCSIHINAKEHGVVKQEYNSILIGLQSEPIDLYGHGNMQTIFIRPREVKVDSPEITNQFGAYFQSFILTINPNQCERANSEEGSICGEVGSTEFISKFKNNNEIALFLLSEGSSQSKKGNKIPKEYSLTDFQTGDQIHLAIEVKMSPNYPGVDKQKLFLIAKDKKGIRKAKLFPILNQF